MKFKIGQYVQVTRRPVAWEGAGESEQDRIDLVGHIGVVLLVDDDFIMVKFPSIALGQPIAQRNIEPEALEIISVPSNPLPQNLLNNCN